MKTICLHLMQGTITFHIEKWNFTKKNWGICSLFYCHSNNELFNVSL